MFWQDHLTIEHSNQTDLNYGSVYVIQLLKSTISRDFETARPKLAFLKSQLCLSNKTLSNQLTIYKHYLRTNYYVSVGLAII